MERRAFGGLSVLFNVSWEKHSPWDIQGSSYPSPGSLLKTNVLDKHQSWTKDFFFKYICLFIYFIYFFLHWVFVAVRGLSLVVVRGGYSLLK